MCEEFWCLNTVVSVKYGGLILSVNVKPKVLDVSAQLSELGMNAHRLRCLGHVFLMLTERLLRFSVFCETDSTSEVNQGDQPMSSQKFLKALAGGLSCIDAVRLPGRAL